MMLNIDTIADNVRRGRRIGPDEAAVLWHAPLWLLGELAVAAKRRHSGDRIY